MNEEGELIKCSNCGDTFKGETGDKYCSDKCKKEASESGWTTASIRKGCHNRLITLQNQLLKKFDEKIPYSDIIEGLLNVCDTEVENMLTRIYNELEV